MSDKPVATELGSPVTRVKQQEFLTAQSQGTGSGTALPWHLAFKQSAMPLR